MISRTSSQEDVSRKISYENMTADKLLELSMHILKKPSHLRSSDDIEVLKKSTENIGFFSKLIDKYGTETHALVCQDLTYEYLEADKILFEAGSIGTTFYIILKGRGCVLIRIPVTGENGKVEFELKEVKIMNTGDAFGELAIMEENLKPRAATIKSKDECHLAVLGRASYRKILGIHQKKELDAKIEFLYTIPMFKGWSSHSLKTLTYLIIHKQFIMKQSVYKEGDCGDEVYIIRSGEVKSTKNIMLSYDPREAEKIIIDDQNQVYTYQKDPLSKAVELAVLSTGQIFGEEEAYKSYKRDRAMERAAKHPMANKPMAIDAKSEHFFRETTVTCVSQKAEIWMVHKKHFFPKLEAYTGSYHMLVSMLSQKSQWRKERVDEITKSASAHMNLLIGNSPIKAKSSMNNDIITTIKYKQYSKNQGQTVVKSSPQDIQMLHDESFGKLREARSVLNTLEDHAHSNENLPIINDVSSVIRGGARSVGRPVTTSRNTPIPIAEDSVSNFGGEYMGNKPGKRIIVAENPNVKFWDIRLDTRQGDSPGSPQEASHKKERLRSLKTKPVHHNPESMLNQTMSTKRKIHETLKNTSFVNQNNDYNAIREYNQFNISLFKMPLKSKEHYHAPVVEGDEKHKVKKAIKTEKTEGNASDARNFARMIQVLKSRSKFAKGDDDGSYRERNAYSVYTSPSKHNMRTYDDSVRYTKLNSSMEEQTVGWTRSSFYNNHGGSYNGNAGYKPMADSRNHSRVNSAGGHDRDHRGRTVSPNVRRAPSLGIDGVNPSLNATLGVDGGSNGAMLRSKLFDKAVGAMRHKRRGESRGSSANSQRGYGLQPLKMMIKKYERVETPVVG